MAEVSKESVKMEIFRDFISSLLRFNRRICSTLVSAKSHLWGSFEGFVTFFKINNLKIKNNFFKKNLNSIKNFLKK
jgi:hypothetical protein